MTTFKILYKLWSDPSYSDTYPQYTEQNKADSAGSGSPEHCESTWEEVEGPGPLQRWPEPAAGRGHRLGHPAQPDHHSTIQYFRKSHVSIKSLRILGQ